MATFDLWLLEKFETFSRGWQKWTGRDCFFLAKQCCILFVVINVFSVTLFNISNKSSLFFTIPYTLTIIYITFCCIKLLEKTKTFVKILVSKGIKNYGFLMFSSLRILSWLVSMTMFMLAALDPPSLDIYSKSLAFLFLVFFCYFISCTPLPPAKSKIKKMIESAGNMIKEALSPPPMPQPIPIPSE